MTFGTPAATPIAVVVEIRRVRDHERVGALWRKSYELELEVCFGIHPEWNGGVNRCTASVSST